MNFRYRAKACALVIFALFLVSIPLVSFAQTTGKLPDGVERTTSVEGITEYQLKNGLRVLLFPDPTKQTVTVNITYLVGSRHENYGETGMAHLLEHLAFKGTPKHQNIPQELTSHGASPNGSTWYDRTNYYETFAATDENLNWALDLESDRMINSYIAKKDLDSEFSVVRNEMESGENSPFRIVWQRVNGVAFEWHNYGKNTIGARSDVENVPIDRLKAFYQRYYQPDNAVLVVAGKIDEAKTLELVQKYFAGIPRPTRELQKIYTLEPVQDGARTVNVNRIGDTKLVMAGYHTPSGSHPEYAAVEILNTIMTTSPSGRLYKALVETKKATSVTPLVIPYKDPGYNIFVAQTGKDQSIDELRTTLIQTLETFGQNPPSAEEIERAKIQSAKGFELLLNNPQSVALELSEWIARGDWRLMFLHRDRLTKVTAADVQKVANKYLKESNRTIGQFIPTEKPDRAEVPKLSDDEIAGLVKDYKGNATVAAGEAFDPSPANIEARTKRGAIGGLKTAFLAKENRGDSVVVVLNLRLGDAKSLMNRDTAGGFAGNLLMRGTAKHSRQQIKDEFDRLKASVNVFGGATSAGAIMTTTRQNLAEVLKLVAEILKEPAFPQSEFDQLKQQSITGLESNRTEPGSIASEAMSRHFNRYPKGDIRYAETLDESLAAVKAVSLDDVKKFYKDFYGASTGELTIVGDFDEKQITPLVTELFGNWKSPAKYERVPSEYFDIPAANKAFETPDKANAIFLAQMNIKMKNDHPDYAALTLGNFILGGGFLNSRLATRIRQKEGLSYSVGSGFGAGALDESGSFSAFAIYAPENVDKLEAAFKDEINKAVTTGFTSAEIEEAKKGWLLSRVRNRASDGGVANTLANYLFINRTFAWDDELEKKVQALTPEQINAAMKKYLTPDKISIFKAGDFAKSKAAKP